MSEYHRRRSRVLSRLAKLHPDEYADLLAYERANEGLDPAPEQKAIAECGTRSGAYRHYKNGERVCDACRQANRDYHADRKARGIR